MELNPDNMNSKLEGVHKLPHQYLTRGKCLFNYYHHSNIIIISPLMIGLSLLILHNQLVLPKFRRCKQYTINTVVHMHLNIQLQPCSRQQIEGKDDERVPQLSKDKITEFVMVCDCDWLPFWGVGWRNGSLFRLGPRIFWFYLWILEVSGMSLSLVYCALFFNHALTLKLNFLL